MQIDTIQCSLNFRGKPLFYIYGYKGHFNHMPLGVWAFGPGCFYNEKIRKKG